MKNLRLKQAIETLVQIFEAVSPMDMEYFDLDGIEMDSIRMYLAAYLCYLSISDNEISWDECEVIEYYTGLNFDPSEIAELSASLGVGGEDFIKGIPYQLQILVYKDNTMFQNGFILEQFSSELFVEILKALALVLLTADGEVSDMEQASYYAYIQNIENYVNSNLNKNR